MMGVKMGMPRPKIKGTAICIYRERPDVCPKCNGFLAPTEQSEGAPENTVAYACFEYGHRLHVWTSD